MQNGGISCGGFTYELEYISGPAKDAGIDPMTVYTLSGGTTVTMTSPTGSPAARVWLGTHQFRFKCTNGDVANTQLYNSVYTDPFTVILEDPCARAIVNQDGGVKIGDISDAGAPAVTPTWTYPGTLAGGFIDATGS